MTKKILLFIIPVLLFSGLPLMASYAPGDGLSKVFARYIRDGRPNYGELKHQGSPALESYLKGLASFDISSLKTDQEKKAFWLNVYNAFALKLVSENYPTNDDIFKVNGFFDLRKINVAGKEYTLNDISSNELKLGAENKDPRLNFAFSNGTKGSPKLKPTPFDPKNIDNVLDDCVRQFLSDPKNFYMTLEKENAKGKPLAKGPVPKIMVSTIFRWFASDFGSSKEQMADFIAKFVDDKDSKTIKKNLKSLVIDYIPYDWTFEGFDR